MRMVFSVRIRRSSETDLRDGLAERNCKRVQPDVRGDVGTAASSTVFDSF